MASLIRTLTSNPLPSILLAISVLLVGINLFNFPYYESDEGTYMSQAWSVVTQSRLSPYVYTYDHAPAGWLLIAFWSVVSGGFDTFGYSINSGRILILVLHFFTSLLLFLVTKKTSSSNWTAVIALLFFSLTPLSIYYHRRVLLDNIMVFWVFFSLYFLTYHQTKFGQILSALTFGIALLTKETAIFFIPGFIFLLFTSTNIARYRLVLLWLFMVGLVVSIYPIWAYSQDQLFPPGMFGSEPTLHPSLIGSILTQLNRSGGSPLSPTSALQQNIWLWFREDPLLVIIGFSSLLANIILSFKYRLSLTPLLFVLPMLVFFVRGGVIFEFYLIPLIPFLAMSVSAFLKIISDYWGNLKIYLVALSLLLIINLVYFGNKARGGFNIFRANQTKSQIEATEWILSQNQPSSFWAIDQPMYLDMVIRNQNNFNHAYYYWKIETDPTVKDQLLSGNPQNINYLAVTPQMEADIVNAQMAFMSSALSSSEIVKIFENDGWRVIIRSNFVP
jgi:4-amino-4-deoxy-L-arabinose transferase-like glycosyltransferase